MGRIVAVLLCLLAACGGGGTSRDGTIIQTFTWPAGSGVMQGTMRKLGESAYTNKTNGTVDVDLAANVEARGTGSGGTAFAQIIVQATWRRLSPTGVVLAGGGSAPLVLEDGGPMADQSYRHKVAAGPGETITLDLHGGGKQNYGDAINLADWPAGSFWWIVESVDVHVIGP